MGSNAKQLPFHIVITDNVLRHLFVADESCEALAASRFAE